MTPSLRLRPATMDDASLLWEWANDPVVRAASFSPDPIAWPSHEQWLRKQLADKDCRIFIALDPADVPVGQIRFDREGDETVVDCHIAPEVRGKGLGSLLITEGVKMLRGGGAVSVHAYVKTTNMASYRSFLKAGFMEREKKIQHREEVYHLVSV